jgi:hypothetical protein
MVKSLSTLAVVFVTMTYAQQDPGIPDRVAALEAAVAALQGASATSQSQVTAVQNNVAGMPAQLSGLQNSVSALQSSNAALQNQATTVQNVLTQFQNQKHLLDNTVTSLQNLNQVYVAKNSFFELDAGLTLVQTLQVPAGSYLIYAMVPTLNFGGVGTTASADQTGECFLSRDLSFSPPTNPGNPGSASDVTERIQGSGFCSDCNSWYANLQLLDVASFSSNTGITLWCTGFTWVVRPTLWAISVGNIN